VIFQIGWSGVEAASSRQDNRPVNGGILGVCSSFNTDEKGSEAMYFVGLYTPIPQRYMEDSDSVDKTEAHVKEAGPLKLKSK
jgi:hypothetical protein